MNKLTNYIYLSISEKSFEIYEKTRFMSYFTYCENMKNNIKLNCFTKKESAQLFSIFIYLNTIYGLDKQTSFDYILEYFLDEKYRHFEEPVRLMREYFRNSFI